MKYKQESDRSGGENIKARAQLYKPTRLVVLANLPKKKRGEGERSWCLDLVFAKISDEMMYMAQHQQQKK